jgi:hypothetical protein
MPNYDAPADLHRLEMTDVKPGHPNHPGPRRLRDGKFGDLVKQVIAKRLPDAQLYSITTNLEAGFQKTLFQYPDIVEVYNRTDFPR